LNIGDIGEKNELHDDLWPFFALRIPATDFGITTHIKSTVIPFFKTIPTKRN
jgi:hypothetical protein